MEDSIFDCVILGGGPGGLSAALYCARGGINSAIIDTSSIGGAPVNYCEIENYLGFSKIQGYELSEKFEEHVDRFNIKKFPYEEIQSVELLSPVKKIVTLNGEFRAKSIIIATGARPRQLGVKGEIENIGRGVSYCAVCDGSFYKDKIVAVVGGGNSALEEAIYLTKHAKKVYIIHRRDKFRADEVIQKRVSENKKIELILNSTVEEILSEQRVHGLKIKDVKTGEINVVYVDGVFPYIGLSPNSEIFQSQLQLDKNGFIITDSEMKTTAEGVFAVGDVRNTPLRQVITAVSDGAIAGVKAVSYLSETSDLFSKYTV